MRFLNLFLATLSVGFLTAQPPELVSVIGVGDIMLGSNYPSEAYLPPDKGSHLLAPLNPILRNATLTFGNLEGSVLNAGGNVKQCSNPSACYAFRMPEYLLDNLTAAGFDVVSIANNHINDFGEPGRLNAPKALAKKGLAYAGLLSCPTTVVERDGIRFGIAAFAPNTGTVNINDLAQAAEIVRSLKQKCDIIIVSFHGGAEGSGHQHVPRQSEIYFGENRGNVYKFAHTVIDAGADIVFGHGPHVTRAVELYKDRFIAYSLGNFCTYKQFSLKGVSGIAPVIKVFTDARGRFVKADIIPIFQEPAGGVFIDPQRRAVERLQTLTEQDFPETPLRIDDTGAIRKEK